MYVIIYYVKTYRTYLLFININNYYYNLNVYTKSFTQIIINNKIMKCLLVQVNPLMSHMCNTNEVNTTG